MGAYFVSTIDNKTIKPIILVVLIAVALYTYFNRRLGVKNLAILKQFG